MYKKVALFSLVMSHLAMAPSSANAVNVSNWDELVTALQTPEDAVLTQDITIDETKTITAAPNGGYAVIGEGFNIVGKEGGATGEYQRVMDLTSNTGTGDALSVVNTTFKNFVTAVEGLNSLTEGGAIIQVGQDALLKNISANFADNSVIKTSSEDVQHRFWGGNINNLGSISSIYGAFERNSLQADVTGAGSANSVFFGASVLANQGQIDLINGLFSNNMLNLTGDNIATQAYGGVIRNFSLSGGNPVIGQLGISGNAAVFSNNQAVATSSLSAQALGGAISNNGTINVLYASLTDNKAVATTSGTELTWAYGGALANTGNIDITVVAARDNVASATGKGKTYARGGAIYLEKTMNNLSGEFSGNEAVSRVTGAGFEALAQGGAIYGEQKDDGTGVNNLSGTFNMNRANAIAMSGSAEARGGAIYTQTRLAEITNSLFNDNSAAAVTDSGSAVATGGAISSTRDLVIKNTSFTNNSATATTSTGSATASGGAVYTSGNLTIIADGANSIFADNNVVTNVNGVNTITSNDIYMADSSKTLKIEAQNGGIFQFNGSIDGANGYKIAIGGNSDGTVNMNGNILNASTIDVDNMDVNFNPQTMSEVDAVITGTGYLNKLGTGILSFNKEMNFDGIFNQNDGTTIVSNQFVSGNTYIRGGVLELHGGASVNNLVLFDGAGLNTRPSGTNYNLAGDMVFYSGATLSDNLLLNKGDVDSLTVVNGIPLLTNGSKMQFGESDKATLNFANVRDDISFNGSGVFVGEWNKINIGVSGAPSNMTFSGDLKMVGTDNVLTIGNGSSLEKRGTDTAYSIFGSVKNNGLLGLSGGGTDILTITGDYIAGANSVLALDVDPDALTSDVVKIDGDLQGETKLTLKASSATIPDGKIVFFEAPNDNLATSASFDVLRVEGSMYDWQAFQDGTNWYFGADKETITPEVASYASLPSIAVVQSASMLWNLKDKVINAPRSYKKFCRRNYGNNDYSCYFDRPYNFWFAPAFSNVEVKYPFEYSANVYGGDVGLDFLTGDWGKLGIFASYRNGDFDITGKGKEYKVSGTADVDVNSYFGGLYYNLEAGHFWALAAAYGGVLDGDVETDDKVTADVKGTQVGASLDMGYTFNLRDNWNIEPSVGVQYTRVDLDESEDSNKVTATYEALGQVKASAGLKFEKYYTSRDGVSSIYFEPSVIKTYNNGNTVKLMDSLELPTIEDDTYVRLNVGGSLQLSEGLKAFGNVSNTFNSDFRDTSVNIGLNYAF